ncbi:hypothetical protein QJV43_gp35 [Serratia phage Serbin]|uniref:Uncharacterized protein n=2 Tax=Serbinvirus TaxID=3153074 RepID=A0A482MGE4_9CAUD|nr:hypothetical protein QJV43_gp35 [Serratia phage Serbin]YP_010774540.1 hypothetical protein QJV46_gp34 [Serratia phage vB_SmaS_Opt-155]QBQ72951.1 hypothetical protein CPT_Serbin_035 [Serratia phage Serbin]UGO52739.1 hypothetical protein OPT155_34 [Serratia phage vB_SmaS_Opt-155]
MEPLLYKKLLRACPKPKFHWQRHEDKLASGIADCSYASQKVCGWVELKTYDSWPRKAEDPMNFSDLQPEQRNWLVARGRACGRVYLLLQVKDDWLLLHWTSVRLLGSLTKRQLFIHARLSGKGPIDKVMADVLVEEA